MSDSDSAAIMRRVEETLNAATQAVSQKREWADRIRGNWGQVERSELNLMVRPHADEKS